MSRIKILPEILSNKIAAGEVVERPASVVKELVENAIDAKSTRIHIEVEKGGRSLLRVSDNGTGMKPDDALLAIERYATSKISDDSDLFSIRSLGFRGEALPSIASVSRFTLVTRDETLSSGTKLHIQGGKITEVTETGAPVGTMISVNQLFYNTPARRKFLKAISTEMGHIADTVSSIALGWPEIQFRLSHNGRQLKNWSKTTDPIIRAADVLGKDIRRDLHKINYENNQLFISGLISSPDVFRSTSQKIFIFVNGRYIRDRGLQHALFEGYKGRLMKGRFPIAVIYIKIPPDLVDVNVHPTKHEVRFADRKTIYNALRDTVTKVLFKVDRPRWSPPERIRPKDYSVHETQFEFKKKKSNEPFPSPQEEPDTFTILPPEPDIAQKPDREDACKSDFSEIKKTAVPEMIFVENEVLPDSAPVIEKAEQQSLWKETFFSDLSIIGQYRNTYIICESQNGLIFIDQHAAHERVYYETLKKKSGRTSFQSQSLLVPETIDLGFREADILEKMIPDLLDYGLEIEPFGGNTYIIKSVPAILSNRELKPVVTEIIDKMLDVGFTQGMEDTIDQCLIIMACHSVIRAHQSLSPKEIKTLLEQLDACDDPSHCPHGRPTWIKYTEKDLEKAFKRIV